MFNITTVVFDGPPPPFTLHSVRVVYEFIMILSVERAAVDYGSGLRAGRLGV